MTAARRLRTGPTLLWIALAVLVALASYGSLANHIFAQWFWDDIGWRRFERFTAMFLAGSAIVIAARPALLPKIAIAVAFTYAVLGVGAAPVVTVCALLFCSYVVGSAVIDGALAIMAGIGLYILALFFVVHWPINYPPVYIGLLALPLVFAWKITAACARRCFRALSSLSTGNRVEAAAFALAAFILTAHLLVALKPDISADGLGMHLAIPADVAYHHRYTFQPNQTLWAVMPMDGDWAYTFAYVLGGEYAAKLFNFAMLLVIAGLLFGLLKTRVAPASASLIVALFASTPLVQSVTGSLFVENTLAAFCFAALVAVWRFRGSGESRLLLVAAFLLGTALGVKFGALAFVAAVVVTSTVFVLRRFAALPRRSVTAATMVALFAAPASLPYANAWLRTANPIYPFLNERFASPLLDRDAAFEDQGKREPLRWRTPYDLTFHTSRFYEGQDGSAGFMILVVVPLAVLTLLLPNRDWMALSATAVFLIDAMVVFSATPNLRYIYPVLPVACIAIGGALAAAKRSKTAFQYGLLAVIAGVTVIQIYMMPSSGWYQKDFYTSRLTNHDDATYLREHAPIRLLVAWMNANAPDQPVLFVRDNQIAGLHGLAYSTVWHHYPFLRLLYQCGTAEDVLRLTKRLGIKWFIAPFDMDNFSPPLNEFLAKYTVKRVTLGNYYVSECRTP